ncbi:MAG: MCE family protein [Pseudonocardiaceae bacterium]|nr:MCE family protein [Pseudonocardiaceae bacterium]
MTTRSYFGSRLTTIVAVACVLTLLLMGALWWATVAKPGTTITAYFSRAVGVYAGSDVRVLGIKVGEVDSVQPRGSAVRVSFTVAPDVPVAPNVRAAVVTPSLVSDRYIQLTPAYDSGPRLASGAVLRQNRTAVPVELDQLYNSVNKLSTTLGPNGANSRGALSNVLDTASANLSGNGERLGQTIRQLGKAADTLSGSRGDLFSTVDNLAKFTKALAASDAEVRTFSQRLAGVSGYLAEDSQQLGAALNSLAGAMREVQGFLVNNKDLIKSNVRKLTGITQALADQRGALAEVLDVAPVGLTNFLNTYDAASGSFSVRGAINEMTYPPALMLCKVIKAGTPKQLPQAIGDMCEQLSPLLDNTLALPSAAETLGAIQQGKLPPLPLPLVDQVSQGAPIGQGGSG